MLAATALLVFHSRESRVRVGVSALLLANFLTYQQVWEHHITGVCVVAAILMTVPNYTRLRYVSVLFCLLLLALPTHFGLMDIGKGSVNIQSRRTLPPLRFIHHNAAEGPADPGLVCNCQVPPDYRPVY